LEQTTIIWKWSTNVVRELAEFSVAFEVAFVKFPFLCFFFLPSYNTCIFHVPISQFQYVVASALVFLSLGADMQCVFILFIECLLSLASPRLYLPLVVSFGFDAFKDNNIRQ
jgi:hypothetical protein